MVDQLDVSAVTDGYKNVIRTRCPTHNIDIKGSTGCEPDGVVDLFDLLAVLDAFAGEPNCPCPGACCGEDEFCLGELREEECNALGASWLGGGVLCYTDLPGDNGNNCTKGECLWIKDTITAVNGCPEPDCDAYSEVEFCNGDCVVGFAKNTCKDNENPGIQGLTCPSGGQNRQCNVKLKLQDCIVSCTTNKNFTSCQYKIASVIDNNCTVKAECTSMVNQLLFSSTICTSNNQCNETDITQTCAGGGDCKVKLENGACKQPTT